jgi:hypothetical protein
VHVRRHPVALPIRPADPVPVKAGWMPLSVPAGSSSLRFGLANTLSTSSPEQEAQKPSSRSVWNGCLSFYRCGGPLMRALVGQLG